MADDIAPTTIRRLQSGVLPAYAMLAGMQLELFTMLAQGPASAEDAAKRLGVDAVKLAPLLYALVVAGLLELRDGAFANTEESATFLVKGEPRYMGGVHEAWSDLWQASLKTALSVFTGKPQGAHDFATMPGEQSAAFLRGLFPAARAMGRMLAQHFDFSACRSVIDIGGGSGGTLIGLCELHPGLRGTLFDLAAIVPFAERIVADAGFAARIGVEAGDIVKAPPKARHDAAVLCAVVQLLAPAEALSAIRHAVTGLEPGGTIYISGRGILDDSRLAPAPAVFTNLVFLNLYEHGRAYTQSEYFGWLTQCGCVAPERTRLPDGSEIIFARKT